VLDYALLVVKTVTCLPGPGRRRSTWLDRWLHAESVRVVGIPGARRCAGATCFCFFRGTVSRAASDACIQITHSHDDESLNTLEHNPSSMWVTNSPSIWAFPMFLFLHTTGLSIVAGGQRDHGPSCSSCLAKPTGQTAGAAFIPRSGLHFLINAGYRSPFCFGAMRPLVRTTSCLREYDFRLWPDVCAAGHATKPVSAESLSGSGPGVPAREVLAWTLASHAGVRGQSQPAACWLILPVKVCPCQ